ncbi:hypothetical protein BDD12DRAFT_444738 [Trichophaea hybrida]|nr:hypothetical protein BDD12DRAFT_444738 [Trichophaea hybrida]
MLASHLPKTLLLAFTTRSYAGLHLHFHHLHLSNTARSLHSLLQTRGLQFSQFPNMFSRAVKSSHELSRPSAAATTRPPATTTTMQISLQDAFTTTKKPDILKPSLMNGSNNNNNITSSYRKQQNGGSSLATVFNATSAFQENVPPPTNDPTPNGVSALHDAVYFDDADFSDDGDLDFDTSAPILYPALEKAVNALPDPPRQQQQIKMESPSKRQAVDTYDDLEFPPPLLPHQPPRPRQQKFPPSSSAPVPWSSSPVEHLLPAKRRADHKIEEEEERRKEDEPVKKKRTLPWKKEGEEEEKVAAAVKDQGETAVKGRKVAAVKGRGAATVKDRRAAPGTGSRAGKRNTSGDSLPWNESFSNLEAGKKEARKRNAAKLQKRNYTTASDDLVEIKKTKPIAGIFLSEEQRKVVDLVTQSKQSVFFTGSAGKCLQVFSSLLDYIFFLRML